jgi:hypothetical protein
MGQPTPVKLVEAFAINAPNVTTSSIPGGKTNPFPVPSQISTSPGSASLNDGFTSLNMTPLVEGGIPPSGNDMNGILYLLSTVIAAVSAGQLVYPYDGTYATAIGGYAKSAQVQDATNVLQRWTAAVVSPRDPAVHPEDWISNLTLVSASAPTVGTHADNVLPGPSDFFLEVTGAGAVTLNGFVAQRDGQRLVISNLAASALTIGLAGTAANQVRMSSAITLLQNDSITIQYDTAIGKWIQV